VADGDMIVRGFTGGVFVQNTYLVSCVGSGKAIIVDPGAAVGEALRVAEESSLDVVAIVLTHAHIDHVDGAAEAKRRTGAPIALHPADEQLYPRPPSTATSPTATASASARASWRCASPRATRPATSSWWATG
jgi:hydroxyacylglutathione hydrolase